VRLLEPLAQSGTLYADARANAVFLLRDAAAIPVGAELRGATALAWRGMAPGSRKDRGFFWVSPATSYAIVLCESAIERPQLPYPSSRVPLLSTLAPGRSQRGFGAARARLYPSIAA